MTHRRRSERSWVVRAACLLCMCAGPMLTGCSSYAIKGRVIRGPIAEVRLVSKNDPRLTEPNSTGNGATVSGLLQPDTPTEHVDLGRQLADNQGWFTMPVDAFGSGFLLYEARLIARRSGSQGAMGTIALPGRSQRVLITLPAGVDTLPDPSNFRDQFHREADPYLRKER